MHLNILTNRHSLRNTCQIKSQSRTVIYMAILFVLNSMLVVVNASDFYQLLGVDQNAEKSAIKKAFR